MFEWLDDEIARIKTRKFHWVDGPASAKLRRAIVGAKIPIPASYREFALRFGNAKLYRYSSNYYVTVFAAPRECEDSRGETYLQIGRTWTSRVFFKRDLLTKRESPVFESYASGMQRSADGFEAWLETRCRSARRRFKKREWAAIEAGPSPFSAEEQAVVAARRLFRWKVTGVAANGDLLIEVHNGSKRRLPYLSLGVRGTHRESPLASEPLMGGVFLPTASIAPGKSKVIAKDCYTDYVLPEKTVLFDLPDPGPEDREQYWEFRGEKND